MTSALFYKLMDELKAHHQTSKVVVALSYAGESMLHPQFEEFSRAAAKMGFSQLQLATNGTCLNPHNDKVLLDCYTQLAISVHNQPGHRARVLEKTKTLFHMRKGLVPSIRLNVVAEEFTEDELSQIEAKMRGHCDNIKVFTAISEDMRSSMDRSPTWPFCGSMYMYLAVLWNGETLPCCHLLSPGDWSLGSVTKNSLFSVFRGKAYQTLRTGNTEGTICHTCEIRR